MSQSAERAAAGSAAPKGRVRVGRVVLFGAIGNLVMVGVSLGVHLLTEWTGFAALIAAPIVGMTASVLELVREAVTGPKPGAASPAVAAPAQYSSPDPRRPRRGSSVVVGVVVTLIIGAVGAFMVWGVLVIAQYFGEFFDDVIPGPPTSQEEQELVPRLQGGPVTVDADGLVTTIVSVDQSAELTRVGLTVQNNLANSVTLRLPGNATLAAEDGTTLAADMWASDWEDTIAAGQLRKGSIVFDGALPAVAVTATFAFGSVFEMGFEGPDSIVVGGLVLVPLEE